MITRRGFLGGLLAAPAIIKVTTLMPVKVLPTDDALRGMADWWAAEWSNAEFAINDAEAIGLWSR